MNRVVGLGSGLFWAILVILVGWRVSWSWEGSWMVILGCLGSLEANMIT